MDEDAISRGNDPHVEITFLLGVDNTLLDNDYIESALKDFLTQEFGAGNCVRYWALLDKMRGILGYASYLGALQRYQWDLNDPRLLFITSFLLDYPFAERVYPGALETIEHLAALGLPVILSDGDAVLQPRKIQQSGLRAMVENRVLIYKHKEKMLDAVMQRYPAQHYVMVDDKLDVLASMKGSLGDKLTTVHTRQGQYAADSKGAETRPPADITIQSIADLVDYDLSALMGQVAERQQARA